MRRAFVDIDGQILADCARVINDAGFRIVGSLESPGWGYGGFIVRLVVEGDDLPEGCELQARVLARVSFQMTSENYGTQRLTKISGCLVGPSLELTA